MPELAELTTLEQIKELPDDSVIVCRMYFDGFAREWVYIKAQKDIWLSGLTGLESSEFIHYFMAHERIFLIHRGQEPTQAEIDAWNAI